MEADSKKQTLQRLTTRKLDVVEADRIFTLADGEQDLHPFWGPLPAPHAPPIRGLIEQHGSTAAIWRCKICTYGLGP